MTKPNPEAPTNLPPEVKAFFDKKNARYTAIADEAEAEIEAAKVGAKAAAADAEANPNLTSGEGGNAAEGTQNNGRLKLEEQVNFSGVNKDELEKNVREKLDHRGKLLALRKSLGALGGICKEISDRKGWFMLTEAVKNLSNKELIDHVYWKQKFDWSDKQLDALNAGEQGELASPKEIEDLFLELHDLLVASQTVLFEIRKRESEPTQKGDQTFERRRVPFSEKLTRLRALVADWESLHEQVPKSQHTAFHVAIKDVLGLNGLIRVSTLPEWLDKKEEEHHWQGSEAVSDKRLAGGRLNVLEKMVAVAQEKLPEFIQQLPAHSSRKPRGGGTDARPVGGGEAKPGDPQEKMGSASRDAEKAFRELVQLLEAHPDRDLQVWFDGPEGREELPINDAVNRYFEQVLVLSEEYKTGSVDVEEATNRLQSLERKFKALQRRFLEFLAAPISPDGAINGGQQKQFERNKERLEALQGVVNRFNELYNDFHLSEDRPTNRPSYERHGKGERAEAGKIILPPLDEDKDVVTNPGELLKQGIHDIYAEFFLIVTPEKLQEIASAKGVEGARRFEAYHNRLMNLYNKLWAQIEAIDKVPGRKSATSADVSDQSGPRSHVDRSAASQLSPEALERQRAVATKLEQQKQYWLDRIQTCPDKKTFDDITSEGDRMSDAWTDCPEFMVGKTFFQQLHEQQITDKDEIQAIKTIAWRLQKEVKAAYLLKRAEFYPTGAARSTAATPATPDRSPMARPEWGSLEDAAKKERVGKLWKELSRRVGDLFLALDGKLKTVMPDADKRLMIVKTQGKEAMKATIDKGGFDQAIEDTLGVKMKRDELAKIKSMLNQLIDKVQ